MINHHFKAEHNGNCTIEGIAKKSGDVHRRRKLTDKDEGQIGGLSDGSGSSGAVARRMEFKGRDTIEEISSKRKIKLREQQL